MEKDAFISTVKTGAIKGMLEYGVLASVTIAQAILESAWGSSAPGNMLFGIKWTDGCGYDKQLLWTTEYYSGNRTKVQANFRKYNSMADSLEDHAKFLKQNSRYSNLLWQRDYKTVCRLIQQDGYATDPNYATSLIGLIEANRLYEYDKLYGWHQLNGVWYYFHKDTGEMVKRGWGQDSKGKWFYLKEDGTILKNGWALWENNWYYLDPNGEMYENQWCYWKASDGLVHQYYLGEKGVMLKSTRTPDGYYVNEKGEWDGKEKE